MVADQKEQSHADRVEDKEEDRAEASLKPAHGPPGEPTDEAVEGESAGGQGDQEGLMDMLFPQVGDRDRHEHDEQHKVPDPAVEPSPGLIAPAGWVIGFQSWCFARSADQLSNHASMDIG